MLSSIRTTCTFLVVSGLLIPACGGDKPPADAKPAKEEKKVAAKDPSTLIEGKAVTIPAVYKGLKPGMTAEEIKKAIPGFPEEDDIQDPAYEGNRFNIGMDDDTGKLRRVWFSMPKATGADMVKKAWGEPVETEDLGKKVLVWFNPENGLRATLKEGFGDDMDLEINAYVPADKFIGAEGPELAFESKQKILGATQDELKAAFPKAFRSKSQEDAEKDQKKIEKLVGEKAKVLGPAKPSVDLVFGPTEYESYWTNVYMTFGDDAKVRRFWFGLAFEGNPKFKDTLFEMFKSKWGDPKEEDKYGDKVFLFGDDPKIEVKEDTISHKWDVAVEPKKG